MPGDFHDFEPAPTSPTPGGEGEPAGQGSEPATFSDAGSDADGDAIEQAPANEPAEVAAVRDAHEAMRRMIRLIDADGRYPLEAYRFLQEGLESTVAGIHGEASLHETVDIDDPAEDPRHVSGQSLCLGLRDYAVECWGKLAREVLRRWGIRSSGDFGEMVFFLVEHEFLQKTDDDERDHFEDVFSFDDFDDYRIDVSTLSGEGEPEPVLEDVAA